MTKQEIVTFIKTKGPSIYKKIKNSNFSKLGFDKLYKFPEVKKVIVRLLTNDFALFIKELQLISPRPTKFKVLLKNNQYFNIIYNKTDWVVQVEGKKYKLNSVDQEEKASKAISRILEYSDYKNLNDKEDGSVDDNFEDEEIDDFEDLSDDI